jgi:regulator of protease activity HflC (stomatin/prohibitin superfamily)
MLGFRFVKVQPTEYLLLHRRGRVVREGAGQAVFYFAPLAAVVRVPLASVDSPFIFKEVTADFQEVTIQGQLTYRVADPKRLCKLLDYTLSADGVEYASDDPTKLPQRLVNHLQVLTRSSMKSMSLRQALTASNELVAAIRGGLQDSEAVASLGIEILGLSILAVKPMPETARALEAQAREQILREADEAIYARRNAAVEQERAIKENELNTEIAVENKKRQIRETQMEAEKAVQKRQHELQAAEMVSKIDLEQKNRDLVALATENARKEADAKAYAVAAVMKALAGVESKTLQALASVGMDSSRLIALAFRDLAEGADKIGQLNVSPDLLRELLAPRKSEG